MLCPDLDINIIPVTPYQQNCSIVSCKKTHHTMIVDPGGEINTIIDFIKNNKNLQIQFILLTHGHLDHCGQARNLATKLNIPILGPHIADNFWLQQLTFISQNYAPMGFEVVENFTPDQWLDEGNILKLGQFTIKILHTPGHTPGHLVYYILEQKIAWVGDVLFKNSIGRSDFPQGNGAQLLDSIHNKLLKLGDDISFICGHGQTSTLGQERLHNPFLQNKA